VTITWLTTITASIMALVAMDTAASIMERKVARTAAWATAVASTMVAEASMVVEGFTVVAEAAITKARTFGNAERGAKAPRFFLRRA
jgi:hypothetical protein